MQRMRISYLTQAGTRNPGFGRTLALRLGGLLFWANVGVLPAQSGTATKPSVPLVEPGLEEAVKWKWKVEASDPAKWGLPISFEAKAAAAQVAQAAQGGLPGVRVNESPAPALPMGPPETALKHEVMRGESLTVIARRQGVTVEQLKKANGLANDLIRVGQILHIPSRDEVRAMEPPPPVKKEGEAPTVRVMPPKEEVRQAVIVPKYSRALPGEAQRASHIVLTQSYLDRRLFSAGPIDGGEGPMYAATLAAYKAAYPDELNYEGGATPAVLRNLGGAYREYVLREEDFRWIAPVATTGRSTGRGSKGDPAPDWESLIGSSFLAYRSAWEFVAERYHCSESFLRRINGVIKSTPKAGTTFFVPNVEPFEIEKAFEEPVRPVANPAEVITAKIVSNAWMEVRRGELLVARMPVSAARPGLRGRGTWRVLGAIPRPQLVCTGDWANPPKASGIGLSNQEVVLKAPPMGAVLPPGPNNPAGLFWIDLAKGNETTVLPYGLHGTSIPGYLTRQESVGGFRMANWDLARVVRLLPEGTPLLWE
jgi:LysM repeat protein/lipoprotein-anchoring transpeptidase ErfK/SrfK